MSGLIVAPVEETKNRSFGRGKAVFQVEAISKVNNSVSAIEGRLIEEALETELPIEEFDESAAATVWARIEALSAQLRTIEPTQVWDEPGTGTTARNILSPVLGRRRIRRR